MLLRTRIRLADAPGALLAVAKALNDLGGNIVDIEVLGAVDGHAIDDLVVDLAASDAGKLEPALMVAGAEVLDLRRTVRISGQRADLDLLQRIATEPARAESTFVTMAAGVWAAEWAVIVSGDPPEPRKQSAGTPSPLPAGLPEPFGSLPRRASVKTADGATWEVAVVAWRSADRLYIARRNGPLFLQAELVQLRTIALVVRGLTATAPGAP